MNGFILVNVMTQKFFNKNYLKEIIFRIDFHPVHILSGEYANPNVFEEYILDEFPDEPTQVLINDGENSNVQNLDSIWVYQKEDYKKIQISNSYVILSYNGEYYDNKKPFLEDVERIIQALIKIGVEKSTFIGLRYINEITPVNPIKNWENWINPDLINFKFNIPESNMIRSLSKTEYKIKDYSFSFQYGQFNLNYPSSVIRDDFILDYDCFTSNVEEISELRNIYLEMNEIIYNFFIKSIGDELEKNMEG